MRPADFVTPCSRSSHWSRWTGIGSSRDKLVEHRSATCGSKIHMVRCSPSIAAVPWPLLPYSSRLLPCPGVRRLVVLPDAVIKLARQPADHRLVAGVGPAQSAAGQTAQVLVRADHDHRLAHLLGLHGRGHAGGCSAVDDDVVDPDGGLVSGGCACARNRPKLLTPRQPELS